MYIKYVFGTHKYINKSNFIYLTKHEFHNIYNTNIVIYYNLFLTTNTLLVNIIVIIKSIDK